MKKSWILALGTAAMIGCGGSSGGKNDLSNSGYDFSGNTQGDIPAATTTLSGFTVDIDLLSANLGMNPSISASDLIAASCVKNTPVYGIYEDGGANTATVMADAMCNYTLTVRQNTVVHVVAAANTPVLATYSQDRTMVGTSAVTNVPAHICTSNAYSAPSGVAALISKGTDTLAAAGICMYGTADNFTPPFVALTPSSVTVTQTGWTITALTNPMTMPPTFVTQANSPNGIYGIYNAASLTTPPTTTTTITVNGTAASPSMNTYAPYSCDVKPGFITFAPASPVSPSTH